MNTYAIQKILLTIEDLTPTEKLVGLTLALHWWMGTQEIRVKQKTIAQECGLSVRTVNMAIRKLKSLELFAIRRSGRAAMMLPGKNLILRYDTQRAAYQIRNGMRIGVENQVPENQGEILYKAELQREKIENGDMTLSRKRGARASARKRAC